jgi:membrane-associated phospholipid phosphatase
MLYKNNIFGKFYCMGKNMKKYIFICLLLFFSWMNLHGQTEENSQSQLISADEIKFKLVFHNFGWNVLHSFMYNGGLNFLSTGLLTYTAIESGMDLRWRNFGYNHLIASNIGLSALYIGFAVPVLTPLILGITGQKKQDVKLQVTALALTQSLILTLAIQTPLKMITGRAIPGIVSHPMHTRGAPDDDYSRTFNRFSMNFINSWPSGHTATAFSAAATIAEIYKDNIWLKLGVYSYAVLIGLGVSLNVHWASEVISGALIGYAIGKTVGRSFSRLLNNTANDNRASFYFTGNSMGIIIRL